MEFLPTLEKAKEIAAQNRYKVMPVSCEILADICTPIEAMRILKNVSTHCYMLESAQATIIVIIPPGSYIIQSKICYKAMDYF